MKALLFDLDGTLVDSMSVLPATYQAVIRRLGGPDVTESDVVAQWHRGSSDVVLRHFLRRPLAAMEWSFFVGSVRAASHRVELFPEVRSTLASLAAAGHVLGVVTSAGRGWLDLLLHRHRLGSCFRVTVTGDEVPLPKPDPPGLRLACAGLGVTCSNALYIGDSSVDMQCACAAGMRCIHAHWGQTDMPDAGTCERADACASTPTQLIDEVTRDIL